MVSDFEPILLYWLLILGIKFYCLLIPDMSNGNPRTSISIQIEPQREKNNKMTCAPNKDSDQPGHPPSLIRVFAMHLMDSQGPKFFSWWQLGRQVNLLVLSCFGSIIKHWISFLIIGFISTWAMSWENLFLPLRTTKVQTACASAQSDQHLYYSLLR